MITIHKKLEVYWGIIIVRLGGGAIFVALVDSFSHCKRIYELNPHESIYIHVQALYQRNYVPTNLQNINYPRTLAPTNKNDSTVVIYSQPSTYNHQT